MFRKTLTILSLVSLLLSVAAWGVSLIGVQYSWIDYDPVDEYGSFKPMIDLESGMLIWANGRAEFSSFPPREALLRPRWTTGEKPFTDWYEEFSWWPTVTWNPDLEWIGIPLWNAIVVFGLMFVYLRFFRDYRRRKRVKLRLCVACGYDLRGSKGGVLNVGRGSHNWQEMSSIAVFCIARDFEFRDGRVILSYNSLWSARAAKRQAAGRISRTDFVV